MNPAKNNGAAAVVAPENKITRSDISNIPFQFIQVVKGWNKRTAFDGIEELGLSILKNGILKPITVEPVRGSEMYNVIDGERRYRAVAWLIETGKVEHYKLPAISKNNLTVEQKLMQQLLSNEGKPFSYAEKAELLLEISNCGWTQSDIIERTGYQQSEVSNLLLFANLPLRLKKIVAANIIAAQKLIGIVRENTDKKVTNWDAVNAALDTYAAAAGFTIDAVLEEFENPTPENSTSEDNNSDTPPPATGGEPASDNKSTPSAKGKTAAKKATAKSAKPTGRSLITDKVIKSTKVDSMKDLRSFVTRVENSGLEITDNKEVYEFAKQLVNNQLDTAAIIKMFTGEVKEA